MSIEAPYPFADDDDDIGEYVPQKTIGDRASILIME